MGINAVRLREYNKGTGDVLRRWIAAKWKLEFNAGESTPKRPFRPSPVVEVTAEQYKYIMGRDRNGWPNVQQPKSNGKPAFDGWTVGSRQELVEIVQREADQRAAAGRTSARAMLVLHEPVDSPQPQPRPVVTPAVEVSVVEQPPSTEQADGEFKPMNVDQELSGDGKKQMSMREAAKKHEQVTKGKIPDPRDESDSAGADLKPSKKEKRTKKRGGK